MGIGDRAATAEGKCQNARGRCSGGLNTGDQSEKPPVGRLESWIDQATRASARGWAVDMSDPEGAVRLVVEADGRVIARTVANRQNDWLATQNFGGSRHGFHVCYPPLSPGASHEIRIRREEDGRELNNSPILVPGGLRLDEGTRADLSLLLAGITDESEQQRALEF